MASHENPNSVPEASLPQTELVEQYNAALREIVADHNPAADRTIKRHENALHEWAHESHRPNHHLEEVLGEAAIGVHEYATATHDSTTWVVEKVEKDLVSAMSPEDQRIYDGILHKAKDWGADHMSVRNMLAEVETGSRVSMQTALDNLLWQQIQGKAKDWGADHMSVKNLLRNASGLDARTAMEASLDQKVWQQIQGKAKDWGADHMSVKNLLRNASSESSRMAMHAALDSEILRETQQKAKDWGIDHLSVRNLLRETSSNLAREVIVHEVRGRLSDRRNREISRGGGFQGDNHFGDAFWEGFRESREQRQHREHQGRRQHESRHAQKESRRAKPQRDPEVTQIIQKVVATDRQASWLTGARGDVVRVVNTVKKLRRQAEEKGETITDREIYLRYRRPLERDNPNTQTEESFKVVSAMMGGSPKGKLPF